MGFSADLHVCSDFPQEGTTLRQARSWFWGFPDWGVSEANLEGAERSLCTDFMDVLADRRVSHGPSRGSDPTRFLPN